MAQVILAQQLLERLLASAESAGKRSFLNSADLSATSLRQLAEFLDSTRHWPLLADLHASTMQVRSPGFSR
jgi:hypothetical protein